MMNTALVGYTGFVGSNLCANGNFNALFNSKNIEQAYGTNPDLLVFAGLRAEKYLANNAPQMDMALITQAEENIAKINPKKLVLISTIDVFKTPRNVDETSKIDTENLPPYGYNRYQLELWTRQNFSNALIVRLPGLFGKNIKKNFIYDFINVIPSMLNKSKFDELSQKAPELEKFYQEQSNGFYKACVPEDKREELKNCFKKLGFSALNFTDSRSVYQFYNLSRLWSDIQIALAAGIKLLHPATEPISVRELYRHLTGEDFTNELNAVPANYDYRTVHDKLFNGKNGYICDKGEVLTEIKNFINSIGR